MSTPLRARSAHIVKVVAGWVLVVFGVAALVLPGPGLLSLLAGAWRGLWARGWTRPADWGRGYARDLGG